MDTYLENRVWFTGVDGGYLDTSNWNFYTWKDPSPYDRSEQIPWKYPEKEN